MPAAARKREAPIFAPQENSPPATMTAGQRVQALMLEVKAAGHAQAQDYVASLNALAESGLDLADMKGAVPDGVRAAARRLAQQLASEALNITVLLQRSN